MLTKNAKIAKQPSYRLRPDYGQAIVTLTDSVTRKRRDYWLGEYDSSASHEMYRRVLAAWEERGRRLPTANDVPKSATDGKTVTEIIYAYKQFVDGHYKKPSRQTIYMALRVLRQFFGTTPAEEFGPNRLRLVRDQMIKGDLTAKTPRKPWSRLTINKAVHQIVAMFKWASSREMLPASVYQHLKTIEPLRRGRSNATETERVRPVSIEEVEATKRFLSRQVKAIVELQLLTGARGGELFQLRPMDLQTDGADGVWLYRPTDHKTAHHDHDRVICFGPKGQAVLEPFMNDRPKDAYLFSPAEAEAERRAIRSARRKTPVCCGNRIGSNRLDNPKRKPRDHYTAASYRRAIQRACGKASVCEWHPHMLRHTAGTLIRREFGLEAARVALGHSSAMVTDAVYAERDLQKVVDVMRTLG